MECKFKNKCKFYDKTSVICNDDLEDFDRDTYCGIKREFETT